jgi:hypothetical protein
MLSSAIQSYAVTELLKYLAEVPLLGAGSAHLPKHCTPLILNNVGWEEPASIQLETQMGFHSIYKVMV